MERACDLSFFRVDMSAVIQANLKFLARKMISNARIKDPNRKGAVILVIKLVFTTNIRSAKWYFPAVSLIFNIGFYALCIVLTYIFILKIYIRDGVIPKTTEYNIFLVNVFRFFHDNEFKRVYCFWF